MNRLANFLVRRRWPLFALPLVVAIIPLVAVSPDGGGSRAGIVVLAAGVALFAVLLGLHLSGRDPDAEALGRSLDPDPVGAALLTRWLRRSKYFRFVGGTVGAIMGVGFVDGSLVPVLLGALAGIVVGGGLAEVHALRRPRSGPRNADISIRRFADYTAPIDVVALAVAGGRSRPGRFGNVDRRWPRPQDCVHRLLYGCDDRHRYPGHAVASRGTTPTGAVGRSPPGRRPDATSCRNPGIRQARYRPGHGAAGGVGVDGGGRGRGRIAVTAVVAPDAGLVRDQPPGPAANLGTIGVSST